MEICHFIKIEEESFGTVENLHVHLILLDSLDKIPLRIYAKEPFEQNKDKILNWIQSKSNYSEFGNSISVEKINYPKFITNIDYSKSKIGGLISTINRTMSGLKCLSRFARPVPLCGNRVSSLPLFLDRVC